MSNPIVHEDSPAAARAARCAGQPVRPPAPRTIFPLTFSAIPTVTPAAAGPFPRAPAQQPQQLVQPVAPVLAQQQQGAAAALLAAASPPEAPGSAAGAAADSGAAAPGSTQRAAVGAAEAQALSELAVSLDKKEALLVQVRRCRAVCQGRARAVGWGLGLELVAVGAGLAHWAC